MKRTNILSIGLLVIVILLSGCNQAVSRTSEAEKAVIGLLETLKTSPDVEDLKKYVYDIDSEEFENGESGGEDAVTLAFKHMTYQILSSYEESDDTVQVTTEISAFNIMELYTETMKQAYSIGANSDEEYLDICKQILDSGSLSTTTQAIDIKVKNYSGTWKVCTIDSMLANAMLGRE